MTDGHEPRAVRSFRESQREGDEEELRIDRTVGSVDLTHWYTPLGRVLASVIQRLSAAIGSRAALLLTLVIGAGIALLLSFISSRIYDAITESDGVAGLDRPLLQAAMRARSPVLDAIVTGYTDIAGPIGMPILAVVALLILSLRRKSWTPAILIVAAGLGSLLMTIAGKDVIDRERPPLIDAVPPYEYSPSFPSGHTLNAIVVAGIIAYLVILRRRSTHARILTVSVAVLFALTIGLSRVFLGHHWFTDVVAGWTLGGAWLAIIITAHRLYLTSSRHSPPHETTEG
ncbi:phosphatase PAP2 family protein [Glaciihabitans sp. UYNi722]|uniref:phosphatase PAP2 family protein n=1 Tax=Glaciihabitans sp. UYNi722 TaxID=3156344 RepID=UPI0033970600